jgi:hypothetical protein|tara:strand:+ start:3115 stop:3429 length:315 start_codon:yes stop_codon:yes gene_type:complete
MEETKPVKEKGFFGKVKDIASEKEYQVEFVGTVVRLGVVVWSGFIITMNYVDIPVIKKAGNSDITFVASVFTGALATFGLTTGKSNGNGKPPVCPMANKDKPKT